jgi:hypothetical protein
MSGARPRGTHIASVVSAMPSRGVIRRPVRLPESRAHWIDLRDRPVIEPRRSRPIGELRRLGHALKRLTPAAPRRSQRGRGVAPDNIHRRLAPGLECPLQRLGQPQPDMPHGLDRDLRGLQKRPRYAVAQRVTPGSRPRQHTQGPVATTSSMRAEISSRREGQCPQNLSGSPQILGEAPPTIRRRAATSASRSSRCGVRIKARHATTVHEHQFAAVRRLNYKTH